MEQSNWLFKQLQNPKIQMKLKSNWVIATEQKQCQIGYSFFIFFLFMEWSNWLFKQLQNPKIQMELKSNWVIATEQKKKKNLGNCPKN